MNKAAKTIDAATILMSASEMSVLPRRVLGSATMPLGCIAGAAEMIEFLEYAGGDGLVELEAIQETLPESPWRAPRVLCEAPGVAFCDADGESSLHCGPALADWLAAMAFEEGVAAMGITNLLHRAFLPVLAQRLALRGLSGFVLQRASASAPVMSVALCEGGAWTWGRFGSAAAPGMVAGVMNALLEPLFQLRAEGADWLAALRAHGGPLIPPDPVHGGSSDDFCALVAVDDRNEPFDTPAKTRLTAAIRGAKGSLLCASDDIAAARRRTMGVGWAVDHDLWASLMAFADKSLIPSSEQSRLGAG